MGVRGAIFVGPRGGKHRAFQFGGGDDTLSDGILVAVAGGAGLELGFLGSGLIGIVGGFLGFGGLRLTAGRCMCYDPAVLDLRSTVELTDYTVDRYRVANNRLNAERVVSCFTVSAVGAVDGKDIAVTVGKEAAADIYQSGLCLEEYLAQTNQ